ncbi:MAG: hypothetical protein CME71_04585 [Halobacteriovorax sp.]|nr:hypothetical protein [Halobacteriovorax sp.]|tara:strand:- start:483 stop:989 length:507 start_codon:yes stop_codon:yes gene_type:complete
MKLISVLVLALTLGAPSAHALILGKVDIQKVLLSVKQGQKVREELKKEFDKKQGTLQKEEATIRKMQEDFQKQGVVMNDKAKAKKEQEIQEKIIQLQQKSMSYQKEIQEMENKLKKPILDRVKEVIDSVSKTAAVDMTYESSTAPIVYAKDEKDLTDDVIKAYDKKFK